MLPFSPRLRIALATAEALATDQQRRAVTCSDIVAGIVSLSGGVADNLLKARGFSASHAAVPVGALNHDPMAYTVESLRALSGAILEAARRSRELVGIEDMLIGIFSPPSTEVSALLARKKVNLEELLSEVRRQM
jgi:hypothetical protein